MIQIEKIAGLDRLLILERRSRCFESSVSHSEVPLLTNSFGKRPRDHGGKANRDSQGRIWEQMECNPISDTSYM